MTLCPTHHHALFHLMHTIIRNLLSALLLAAMLVACGGNAEVQRQLAVADSLINIDPDSALHTLRAIDYKKVDADCDRAYYNLVLNNIKGKTDGWMSLSDIDYCIDYYTRHYNPQRLQRSYYCRGMADEKISKNTKQAIIDYKKAEDLFEEAKDSLLQCEIYRSIVEFNANYYNTSNIIQYSKKELHIAKETNNIDLITSAHNDMVYSMYIQGEKDSCIHYANLALRTINNCSKQTKATTYKEIANIYREFLEMPDSAIFYYKKAYELIPHNNTLVFLGYAYLENGEDEKTNHIVEDLLKDNNAEIKALGIYLCSRMYLKNNNYPKAYKKLEEATELSDNVDTYKIATEMGYLQKRFDNEALKTRATRKIQNIVIISLASILSLTCVILLNTIRLRNKDKRLKLLELKISRLDYTMYNIKKEKNKSIEEKCDALKIIIQEKQNALKKIEKENKELSIANSSYKKKTTEISEGLQYMFYILQNEDGLQLGKEERMKFIACYKILDGDFVDKVEHACDCSLSLQEKTLCILYRINKSSTEIKLILGMSNDAYRQAKSRMLRKLKEEPSLKRFCDKIAEKV